MPAELQERVHQEVLKAKERSNWPVRKTLSVLGIPYRNYYRWLKAKRWQQKQSEPVKPVQVYEATAEEKLAVIGYARRGGMPECLDGVSHSERGSNGVSVESPEQAEAGGTREGEPSGSALGNGPDVPGSERAVLLLRGVPG